MNMMIAAGGVEEELAAASIASGVVMVCLWMVVVVLITWVGDRFFNREARWVFFWSFLFGPFCVISGPLAIALMKPRDAQDKSKTPDEERRRKAKEMLESGPRGGSAKAAVERRKANQERPEPECYEL